MEVGFTVCVTFSSASYGRLVMLATGVGSGGWFSFRNFPPIVCGVFEVYCSLWVDAYAFAVLVLSPTKVFVFQGGFSLLFLPTRPDGHDRFFRLPPVWARCHRSSCGI